MTNKQMTFSDVFLQVLLGLWKMHRYQEWLDVSLLDAHLHLNIILYVGKRRALWQDCPFAQPCLMLLLMQMPLVPKSHARTKFNFKNLS